MNKLLIVIAACFVIALSACSDDTRSRGCVPGTATACVCAGGAAGTSACGADQLYGACICNGSDRDSGVSTDLGLAVDSSANADMSGAGTDAGGIVTDMGVADSSVDAGCVTAVDCNDRNACTTETCVRGSCVSTAMSTAACDDSNPCTTDACSIATGCVHTANTASCNDGQFCTISDHCSAGSCTGSLMACGTGCVCSEASMACIADTSGFRPALPPTCLAPAEP